MGITTNVKPQTEAEIQALIEEFIRKNGVTRPQPKGRKSKRAA